MKQLNLTNVKFDDDSNLIFETIDFDLDGFSYYMIIDVGDEGCEPFDVSHTSEGIYPLCQYDVGDVTDCAFFTNEKLISLYNQLVQHSSIRIKATLKGLFPEGE